MWGASSCEFYNTVEGCKARYHIPRSIYQTDSRVDDYITTLPAWQQDICRRVRDLVHAADPEVTETIKRTRQPYFVLEGNICALLAARDHLNVFIEGCVKPRASALGIEAALTR